MSEHDDIRDGRTVTGTPSANPTANIPPFSTIERLCGPTSPLPPSERVSKDKLYSLVRQGKIPVYRLPNVKPVCVKVTEVRSVLAALSAQGKIRRGYGSFGPDAVVRDLSNVAGHDFEVLL